MKRLSIAAILSLLSAASAFAGVDNSLFSGGGPQSVPSAVVASTITANGNGPKCFSADDPTLVVDCGAHKVTVGGVAGLAVTNGMTVVSGVAQVSAATFTITGSVSGDIVNFERADHAVSGNINYNGSDGALTLGTQTNHSLAFKTNGSEKMRILPNGNVGIGVSPGAILDIAGASPQPRITGSGTTSSAVEFKNNGGSSYFGLDSAAGAFTGLNSASFVYSISGTPISLLPGGTEKMRIDSLGATVKGQETITSTLTVLGAGLSVAGPIAVATNSTTGTYFSGTTGVVRLSDANSAWISFNRTTSAKNWEMGVTSGGNFDIADAYANSSTPRFRIDNSGNVGLGVTSTPQALTLNGNIQFSANNQWLGTSVNDNIRFDNSADTMTVTLAGAKAFGVTGAPTTGQALCLDANHNLGHCTTIVGASGGCTCSAP